MYRKMLLGFTESLPSLVKAKFASAKASSSLVFSPTELSIIRTSTGIPASTCTTQPLPNLANSPQFQLRFCPSLAKKPIPKLEKPSPTPKKHFDPFDNPSPDLHIANIPTSDPSHLLVLNKFPIIAGHFILATKTNKQQTHILEQDDLEATYACLKAWSQDQGEDGKQKRLFAFFNSGDHSGASQPHRHLQFLPVENMRDHEEANEWDLLIDLILKGEQCTRDQCAGTCHAMGVLVAEQLAKTNDRDSFVRTRLKHSVRAFRTPIRWRAHRGATRQHLQRAVLPSERLRRWLHSQEPGWVCSTPD